jgi:anaerobic magnesium-protoporphyrin IX monomethyl ester cyclase
MKVALLYPEVYDMARFKEHRKEFPPFGVLYLAAVIEEAGHRVVVRKVTPDDIELDLLDFDAVGFSLASSATYGVMRRARRRSRIRDDALVMVGGVHCNFYPVESLRDFDAHVAAEGESEETILEILSRAASKRFDDVAGVLWWDGTTVRRERPRPLLRDIDQLPLPARHLLPTDDFVISDRLAGTDLRMAHVMFSRGCPFPCSFCAAGQTRIQYRSGASARHELTRLITAYGIEGFAIVDDNFIVNKNKVADICDHIADLGPQVVGALAGRHGRRGTARQDGPLRLYRDQVRHGVGQRAPAQSHAKEHQAGPDHARGARGSECGHPGQGVHQPWFPR